MTRLFSTARPIGLLLLLLSLFWWLLEGSQAQQVLPPPAEIQAQPPVHLPVAAPRGTLVIATPKLTRFNHIDEQPYIRAREFVMDFWEYFGALEGYRIELIDMPMAAANSALQKGEIDIISHAFYSEELADEFYYSLPYMMIHPVLLKRAGEPEESIQQLAVHAPPSVTPPMVQLGKVELTSNASFSALLNEQVKYDLIYSWNRPEVMVWLESEKLQNSYTEVTQDLSGIYMRPAVSRENRMLALEINQHMREVTADRADAMWHKVRLAGEGVTQNIFSHTLGSYLPQLTEPQADYVLDHPVASYTLIESGYAPFMQVVDHSPAGFSVDMLRLLSLRLGIEFQPHVVATFEEMLSVLKQEQVDLNPNMLSTEERREYLVFSTPIDETENVIVSHRYQRIASVADMVHRRIAIIRGHTEGETLQELLPYANFIEVSSTEEAILAIVEGRADAFLGNHLLVQYTIGRLHLSELVINVPQDFNIGQKTRMGFPAYNALLRNLVNQGLNRISTDERNKLAKRWMGGAEPLARAQNLQMIYRWGIKIGIALLLLIAVSSCYYRHRYQQRMAAQRTLEDALNTARSAQQQAELSGRAKTDFLARMSHEIRTPMNGVLGMAEALSFTSLTPAQKDLLGTLNGSARNLMALLNDVLDFSKMDAGKLTLETQVFSLRPTLLGVLDNFRELVKSREIKLSVQLDPTLADAYQGDVMRLTQVLNNLVSNAVKFTAKGFIELNAQRLEGDASAPQTEQTDLIRIDVRDSGIGIPAERQAALFSPFVQAEGDTTRRFGGSGLGLSICKEIVEAMGGTITLSSLTGCGSLFSVTLRLPRAALCAEQSAGEAGGQHEFAGQSLKGTRILLAEDNKVNRKVVCGQLRRLGAQVEEAENGLIAYQMQQQGDYDVVLSDCHMPEMDGFILAGRLSAERQGSRPQLVAITADALSGAAQRCLDAGFDDYLSKPCPQAHLAQVLSSAIHRLGEPPHDEAATCAEPSEGVSIEASQQAEKISPLERGGCSDIAEWLVMTEVSAVGDRLAVSRYPELTDSHAEQTINATDKGRHERYLDRVHVLMLSGDDEGVVSEVLAVYLETNPEDLRELSEAAANVADAPVRLKDVAHRVKGSVRYLGAEKLALLAERLEQLALVDDGDELQTLVSALLDGLGQLNREVKCWCEELQQLGEEILL